MLAMIEAREFGATINGELLDEQAVHTHDVYKDRTDRVAKGEGVGGRSVTITYSLWALDLAGRKRDVVSDALVSYLLKSQEGDGHWQVRSHRPPLQESSAMTTMLAAYYLDQFSHAGIEAEIAEAVAKAGGWISASDERSQEGLNAKLWALAELRGDGVGHEEAIGRVQAEVLARQNSDGGWAQLPGMDSDAYATGQTLFILEQSGLAAGHAAIRRGVEFLLGSQRPDGSWFVETRAKPVQKFFDNGDPHGKSQFISIAATSWAVAALCRCGGSADTLIPCH